MFALLRTFSWQELRHHPWRSAAAAVAVMLGVALAFSVHLINASALSEFSSALRTVEGEPDLELRATQGGFDEALYARVAADPGVRLASPVLEVSTLAVTLTFGTGQFILWSYIAPYLKGQVGFSTGELSLVLMWFGMVGLAGNALMSRTVDRTGPAAAVMTSLALSAVTLAAWPLATGFALVAVIRQRRKKP